MPPFVTVLAPTLLLAGAMVAQGEVEPRVTAKKGSSVWLIHEISTDAKLEMRGQEITTSQRTARVLHVLVKDIDAEGRLVVETTIARVSGRVASSLGQGNFDFDSAAEADAPGHSGAKQAMAGAGMKFVSKSSPSGELLELGEGSAAVLDANRDQGSMHQITAHGLRQIVGDVFGLLPQKRTAGGAQWQRDRVETIGRMVTRQRLALALTDVAPDAFAIEGKGEVELALDVVLRDLEQDGGPDKEETERQLKSTKLEKGSVICKQKTSREDGFVLQSSSEMQLDMVTTESQMGEVTIHMTSTTTLARTTAEQAVPKKEPPAKAPADAPKPDTGK
jgi:hypothetical protein